MKKLKLLLLSVLISSLLLMQTGCYGSFTLTNKVYDWNGTVGNDIAVEIVFLALIIIPVYEVTLFIDGIILNTIEFFTGSNPLAMKNIDENNSLVNYKEHNYKISHMENGFTIEVIDGIYKGQFFEVSKINKEWVMKNNGKEVLLPGI